MQYLAAYVVTAVIFLFLDFLWLGYIAKSFYFSRLGELLLDKPNLGVAAGFYAVYVIGLVIFAVAPALQSGSWKTALIYGALFGFFCYATYDMTNLATLKGWPVTVAIVDVIWGTVLTGVSALMGYLIVRQIGLA
jgi:uncharacterized membrane protein